MDARWTAWKALDDMPVSAWVALRPMLVITAVSFVFFSIIALYFFSNNTRNSRPLHWRPR